ncbi:ribosome-binding factor A [Elusimicrobium simillimum]|uniref:30S ribosome-binding factor RbfA n=1 Tax=Elusimicrobium simillimum TaxID=3143438 RepID=UPI003C6F821F
MIDRIKRLEALFLEEISAIISKMISTGSFKGFITVTGVKVSKDLRTARVNYSVFGSEAEREHAANTLSILRSEIGAMLRHRLHLKRIPSFSFHYDSTPEKASKVESIFSVIEKEKNNDK